jgi:hypothetical protein
MRAASGGVGGIVAVGTERRSRVRSRGVGECGVRFTRLHDRFDHASGVFGLPSGGYTCPIEHFQVIEDFLDNCGLPVHRQLFELIRHVRHLNMLSDVSTRGWIAVDAPAECIDRREGRVARDEFFRYWRC